MSTFYSRRMIASRSPRSSSTPKHMFRQRSNSRIFVQVGRETKIQSNTYGKDVTIRGRNTRIENFIRAPSPFPPDRGLRGRYGSWSESAEVPTVGLCVYTASEGRHVLYYKEHILYLIIKRVEQSELYIQLRPYQSLCGLGFKHRPLPPTSLCSIPSFSRSL